MTDAIAGSHRTDPGPGAGAVAAVVVAVARRPWLWPSAVAQARRMARPRWWRRWPPLPLPDAALWRFRMQTAYGGEGEHVPSGHDVASFVSWCGAMRRWRRQ
ncbi:MAG TPA: hypothetical protein VMB72_04095 [Acidimicrobiales bacterium]|nr:hypothetical protein [Acidimicrobiales bacterium]